jgi:hypothetical protein
VKREGCPPAVRLRRTTATVNRFCILHYFAKNEVFGVVKFNILQTYKNI